MRPHPTHRSALLLVVAVLVGCAKDEGPLHVPRPVDPTIPMDTVSFSAEVVPIFTAHCWLCHPPMANGMDLSAQYAYGELVNVPSVNWAPALRVVPGDPEASVLWNKINFTETYGLGMPPNGTPLSSEELRTIREWIEQGAMDN
ncbi:MAG: hypothetical protein E6Q44_15625 [Flavobacteriales bacterium]|jgi:hypothetical protein|nr:MAG: hypothetical protein E6Q44_15625 [Flavobacteriales bacterium]